ncbi:MAG: hypothetical protein LBI05_02390 [Planctomycetaceae bacterium]|nr:hypothetical protein [Planctomycetaceae bacterium]
MCVVGDGRQQTADGGRFFCCQTFTLSIVGRLLIVISSSLCRRQPSAAVCGLPSAVYSSARA